MGNQPSSEASRAHPLLPRPPPLSDRPLPPLPRPLRADELAHAHSHLDYSSPRTSTLTSAHAAPASRFHKPRNSRGRSKSAAAADLKKPSLVLNTDGLAKSAAPSRFSASNFANIVSSLTPKSPLSATFASGKSPITHKRQPSTSSVSAKASGPQSPSVFTFEEAVAAYAGPRDGEPAARKPPADTYPDIYPDPSLDLELLQEQQARQHEFQERQRLNLIQRQKRLSNSKTPMLSPGLILDFSQQYPQHQSQQSPRDYHTFEFQLDSTAIEDLVSDPTDEFDFEVEEQPVDREPRKLQRQFQKERQQLQKQQQRQEQQGQGLKEKVHRASFFRSKSTQRIARPENGFGDLDAGYPRRNSISSAYSYSAGQQFEDLPRAAGTRTSWNYDMSSYAAKRLLHMVDANDHDDPADLDANDSVGHRHEQSSVTSEGRRSVVSEVTWKSSHPVQDENAELKRATSDLSLYAPVRRTSMVNIPGVATRRNSTSSFANTDTVARSSRPSFRHSHTAPKVLSTASSLSRTTSHESVYDYGLSMPVLRRPAAIVGDADASAVRVSTPTDHDNVRYSTIGAYSLGSLRITNGTASPPSPEPKKPGVFDAGSSSPVRSPESERKARSMALAALSGNTPVEANAPVLATDIADIADITKPAITLPPALLQLPLGGFVPDQPIPEPVKTPTKPPQVELPNEVFNGFELSSFSLKDIVAVEAAPEAQGQCSDSRSMLETTSKATALEDLLFEDEDDRSTLGYMTAEVLDVRLDPSAKATAKRCRAGILASHKSVHSVQSVSRSDSGFISSPASETSHKPLSKADSGYSSNVSLRSFKQAASKFMAPVAKAANRMSSDRDANRAPERESTTLDELTLPSPTLGSLDRHVPPIDNHPRTPVSISAASLPAPSVSKSPAPRLVRSSTGSVKTHKKRRMPPTPIDMVRLNARPCSDSQRSSRSCPNPQPPTPGSIHSFQSAQSTGSASAVSGSSGTQRPNKLMRFLSFNNSSSAVAQNSPAAVNTTHVEDDSPHTRRFPMTAKRLALRSQLSNNTLKTIFSVGSLENRGSNGDLQGSSLRDGSSRAESRLSMHRDIAADGTSKRKSRLYIAVDFSDEAQVNKVDEADEINEKPLHAENSSSTLTSSTHVEARVESKSKMSRVPWRRRTKEDVKIQTQTQTRPQTVETGPTANTDGNDKARPRSSSIRSRTMSMTAQLERTLSMKLSFPRLSSNASKPHGPDNNSSAPVVAAPAPAPAAAPARPARPLAPPVSFFSAAAHRNRDQRLSSRAGAMAHRSSIPKDTTATAAKVAAKGRPSASAGKPPVSARMQQMCPNMPHVSPPMRSKSTPPIETGSSSNRDRLYATTTVSGTAPFKLPVDPRWQVKTDHDTSRLPARRASVDSASRTYHGPCVPHRSFSGESSLFDRFSAMETQQHQPHQPQVQFYESRDEQPQSRVIRYRASHDGYSSVATENSQPRLPMSNSNGVPHPRSGTRTRTRHSNGGDIYQRQPQKAGEHYYQPHSRPPSAHAHNRSRSMGSRQGPMASIPRPQAPYRILHSYNSPAYRGVPIWG